MASWGAPWDPASTVASWLVPTASTVASDASDSGTVESDASSWGAPASAAPDSGMVESSSPASMAASAPPLLETPLLETPLLETPLLETPLLETPLLETPLLETPLLETPPLLVLPAEPDSPVASSPPFTSVGLLPPQAATRLPASAPAKANRTQRLESSMRPLGGVPSIQHAESTGAA